MLHRKQIDILTHTFLGWNSYLTQCWKPLPLTFIDVSTRQFPTKWAVYPTPLDVLKLLVGNEQMDEHIYTQGVLQKKKKIIAKSHAHRVTRMWEKSWKIEREKLNVISNKRKNELGHKNENISTTKLTFEKWKLHNGFFSLFCLRFGWATEPIAHS